MKAWKKVLGIAAIALTTVGLAACVGSNDSKSVSKDGSSLLMYQVGDKPDNYDKLMEIANKRIKDKLGITIDLQYISWGDWEKKMPTIINSGESYDIAFAYQYVANAQKGAFADLTKLSQTHAKKYMDQLPDMYKKGNKINGKLYAIPVYGNTWAQQVLTFNEQFVKKYNLDISKVDGSYASATEVLKQFHEKEPNIAAFAIGHNFRASGNFDFPLGKVYPFAVKLNAKGAPKIINQYEDPEFQDTLKVLHQWYKDGLIPSDAATDTQAYPLESNTWFAREETQGPLDYGDTTLSQAATQPLVSRPLTVQLKTNTQAQIANFVVSNTSKNKEKAVEFLNMLNTDHDLLNGLVWGIEGEAWKKVGDTKIKLLDGYKPKAHMDAWNTGNNMLLYTPETVTDEMIQKRDQSIKAAATSPILGFNAKIDSFKTELTNVMNVMNRYAANLNTGSIDPEENLPKLIKELKSAGWDKAQKEMQAQLDQYMADSE